MRSIIRESGATEIFWNRRYEPALIDRDNRIRQALTSEGVKVETFNASLLFDPEEIKNSSGKPFQVFTPFWRACVSAAPDFSAFAAAGAAKTKDIPSLSCAGRIGPGTGRRLAERFSFRMAAGRGRRAHDAAQLSR